MLLLDFDHYWEFKDEESWAVIFVRQRLGGLVIKKTRHVSIDHSYTNSHELNNDLDLLQDVDQS